MSGDGAGGRGGGSGVGGGGGGEGRRGEEKRDFQGDGNRKRQGNTNPPRWGFPFERGGVVYCLPKECQERIKKA